MLKQVTPRLTLSNRTNRERKANDNLSTIFLPDGFQTMSHIGQDAETILNVIGDSKRPSEIGFRSPMGNILPGTMYELTADVKGSLDSGSRTVFFNAGNLMLFHVTVSH